MIPKDLMKCPVKRCSKRFEVVIGNVVQNGGAALYQLHLLEHIAMAATQTKPRKPRSGEETHGD